jgi:3-hydroxyacyl-CoA dehydrogenase
METNGKIHRVAVVGTGVVGASWAAFFLSRGLEVSATDPAPGAESALRSFVDRAWPALESLGLSPGASRDRLCFASDLEKTLAGAQFVQENAPERIDLKIKLFARMDAVLPPSVLIASSSSGLKISAIESHCKHPERCVIGHPFNPPHLIPLVEVVGGTGTKSSPENIERTLQFYSALGKHPIHIRKEVPGHAANRLQAALWREAIHLVAEGVLSVADVDAAVCWGPGLRWGIMGPNLLFHLGGGKGGLQHFLEHLSGPFATWWADLGSPGLTPEIKAKLIAGVLEEAAGRSIEQLEEERNRALLGLLAIREAGKRD